MVYSFEMEYIIQSIILQEGSYDKEISEVQKSLSRKFQFLSWVHEQIFMMNTLYEVSVSSKMEINSFNTAAVATTIELYNRKIQ